MTMSPHIKSHRNAWVELDLDLLGQNLKAARKALPASANLIMVVKANAYGHGMTTVARQAVASGVNWFFVGSMDEAVTLRAALPDANILISGSVWPADVPEIVRLRILPVLVSEEQARELAGKVRSAGLTLSCHFEIDTGMGRLGLPWERAVEQLAVIRGLGGLDVCGISMHFASATDSPDLFVREQANRFRRVVDGCAALGIRPLFKHVSNSAAFSSCPELDMEGVRLGIILYGYGERYNGMRIHVEPTLQWKTRVVQVRQVPAGFPVSYHSTYVTPEPTCLATIDAGYADGIPRLMSNKGYVLVGGRRARIVGRVTMKLTMVDLGLGSRVQPGDEVVLIGRQGDASLWADEVARWCDTIPYEILTNIRSDAR